MCTTNLAAYTNTEPLKCKVVPEEDHGEYQLEELERNRVIDMLASREYNVCM